MSNLIIPQYGILSLFNPLKDIEGLSFYLNKKINVNTKIAADFIAVNNKYLESLDSSLLFDGTVDFTIMFWFYPNASPLANQYILAGKNTTLGTMEVYINSLDKLLFGTNNFSNIITSTGTINTGNWNLACVTYNAATDTMSLSLNNSSFQNLGGVISITNVDRFRLGAKVATTHSFDGRLDMPYVWSSRALTQGELNDFYNSGSGVSYDDTTTAQRVNMLSAWELNETSGDRVDSHGTNDLTDNNSVGYNLGKVQEETQIGELVWNWIDQSSNLYMLSQDVVTQQEILQVDGVTSDNVDDNLKGVVSDAFIGDSSGIIFIAGYRNADGTLSYMYSSSDEATDNDWISPYISATGQVGLQLTKASILNTITSTNAVAVGTYFWYYVQSLGSSYVINLKGINETVNATLDNGDWYSDIPNRDNIVSSGIQKLTPIYSKSKKMKAIYSNAALSASEINQINTFMSNPLN